MGRRQTVRTTTPTGLDWTVVEAAVTRLNEKRLHRAAAIAMLCRCFGVRLREAVLADLANWLHQARELGQIDVREGTKVVVARRSSAGSPSANEVRPLSWMQSVFAQINLVAAENLLKPDDLNAPGMDRRNPSCPKSPARIWHQGLSRSAGSTCLRTL